MSSLVNLLYLLAMTPLTVLAPPEKLDGRDLHVTVHAHRALAVDEVLGPLNLTVRVRLGVATLSGPVPSKEIAERAVKVLATVKGVYEVKSDLSIQGHPRAEDVLKEVLKGLAEGKPPPELGPPSPSGLENPGSGLLGSLRGREDQPSVVISPYPSVVPAGDDEPTRISLPPVSLGLPVPVDERPGDGSHIPAVPVAERQGENPLPDVTTAVERLRLGDRRYRMLAVEVEGGYVIVNGRVERREWLIEFARAVSELPGVSQVDLRRVKVGR